MKPVNPPRLAPPKGFSHGVLAPAGGRTLYVAGQVGDDASGRIACADFPGQFRRALENVLEVVQAAGGNAGHLVRMTVYVTNLSLYRDAREELGRVWREVIGKTYPAMALLEVKGLYEPGALVEIEATAVIPPETAR